MGEILVQAPVQEPHRYWLQEQGALAGEADHASFRVRLRWLFEIDNEINDAHGFFPSFKLNARIGHLDQKARDITRKIFVKYLNKYS